jgi:hypothetical protein
LGIARLANQTTSKNRPMTIARLLKTTETTLPVGRDEPRSVAVLKDSLRGGSLIGSPYRDAFASAGGLPDRWLLLRDSDMPLTRGDCDGDGEVEAAELREVA